MKFPEKSQYTGDNDPQKMPKTCCTTGQEHIFFKPLETVDIEEYPFCSELATTFKAHAAAVDLDLPCV
ncbi:hypothetical protein FVEG_10173 [Fusarium verticillioides 7600]|uniref:Uncharacterized protein n=1 Tax=Gibberella moniliformis (strain M3125 / FGSC 7600) TaxID=334819 RepID=W7MTK5_GIBM7|nr:hypothetical protein FVEG_10173 [Fusarium verticillioides 7600]EWG51069.1 hypothetical protein FVEG_10173 [Fusarium verticillioides 7600]